MSHVKLLTIAVIAAIATALAVGSASANTITAEPSGTIRAVSLGKLTFSGGSFRIECDTTLDGAINTTINNAAGGAIGTITEGETANCGANNEARPQFEGGTWTLTLNEATRLEATRSLATINNNRTRFHVSVAGIACEYEGTVATSLEGSAGSPSITRLLAILANRERRIAGSAFCPREGELRGSFSVTTQTLRLR